MPNTATNQLPVQGGTDYTPHEYDKLYSSYDLSDAEKLSILSQPQKIGSFTWAASDNFAASIGSITWPSTLFHLTTSAVAVNNPWARVTSAYYGFKADIELTFWASGNQNCSGSLLVATRYDRNSNASTIYSAMNDPNATELRCQLAQKVQVVIPYRSASFNYRNPAKMFNAWGQTWFFVKSPLVNASTVTPPALTVYLQARFINIHLLGPSLKAYQSEKYRLDVITATAPVCDLMDFVEVKAPEVYQSFVDQAVPVRQEIEKRITKIVQKCTSNQPPPPPPPAAAPAVPSGPRRRRRRKPSSRQRKQMPPQVPIRMLPVTGKAWESSFLKEAQQAAAAGVSFVLDQIPGSKVVRSAVKSVGRHVAPKLTKTVEDWGFNFPLNQTSWTRTIETNYQPFMWTDGVSNALNLGQDPYQASEQIDSPDGDDYMELSTYLNRPTLLRSDFVDLTTPVDNVVRSFPVCPWWGPNSVSGTGHIMQTGPLNWIANKFGYWRGSLKYRIEFFCPTGVTTTFRITHQPDPYNDQSTLLSSADTGSLITEDVVVTKDLVHELVIPYQGLLPCKYTPKNPMLQSGWTEGNTSGTLSISLANPVVNQFAVNTSIYFTVSVFSDPDDPIVFMTLKDDAGKVYQSDTNPADQEIPAASIIPLDGITAPGFTNNQYLTSIKQIAAIMHPNKIALSGGQYVIPQTWCNPWLRWTFAAFRGNFRVLTTASIAAIRNMVRGDPTGTDRIGTTDSMYADGVRRYFEIPYSSNVPFREFLNEPANAITNMTQDIMYLANVTQPLCGFTDDLQLFYPAWTPNIFMEDAA